MKRNLLLTDVDGTLTTKSVVLSHAGWLVKQGIIKDDGSFQAWSQDMKNESLITAVAENYRSQITGMKVSDMKASEFIKEFLMDGINWYGTLDTLKHRIKDGYEVVLVTGSSDFLVKELAEKLGCDYHATEYLLDSEGCFTGEVKGMFAESQKDDCIQWNFNIPSYSNIEAWGDTVSDYGLFKHANYKLLVAPTEQTLKALITRTTIDRIVY